MMKRTKETKNNQDKNMTLHEAIEKILLKEKKELNIQQIADKIIEQKLYKRRDKKPLRVTQVFARIRNYPSLFYVKNKIVGLNSWEDKKKKEKSPLVKEMEFILNNFQEFGDEEYPVTIEILKNTLKVRNDYYYKFEKDFTIEEILDEIKENDQLFTFLDGKVGLVNEFDEIEYRKSLKPWIGKLLEEINVEKIKDEIINTVKEISVANFKSYSKLQKLSLKPITLLFGQNSSGKSSLIHSILYLHNAIAQKELNPDYMRISGDSVDLGGFKQLIYKQNYKNRALIFEIDFDKNKLPESLINYFKKNKNIKIYIEIYQPLKPKIKDEIVKADKDGNPYWYKVPTEEYIPNGKPKIKKYEILLDSEIIISFKKNSNENKEVFFELQRLNYSNQFVKAVIKKLSIDYSNSSKRNNIDFESLEEALDNIIEYFYATEAEIIPRKIKAYRKETLRAVNDKYKFSDLELFLLKEFPLAINEILDELFISLEQSLENIIYLGPMRSYPTRDFASVNLKDINYYAGGSFAWDILLNDTNTRNKINKWLEKLEIKYKIEVGKISNQLYERFIDTGNFLDFELTVKGEAYRAESIANIIEENVNQYKIDDELKLALVDKTNTVVSPRDVGFGISQIIPVIVSVLANKNKMILIEQPEIHLHPGLQAKLADAMIESALGENKNTLILENHSEHMMLRILRRIRETTNGDLPEGAIPIKPEDVAVIYIQNTEDGSKLNYIPITEDGDFAENWPNGFFEEREKELF